jgi:hypothetical protein
VVFAVCALLLAPYAVFAHSNARLALTCAITRFVLFAAAIAYHIAFSDFLAVPGPQGVAGVAIWTALNLALVIAVASAPRRR